MEHIFPQTWQLLNDLLGEKASVLWKALENLSVHEVPMCIRAEGFPAGISEIAYYESLKFFVENEDQGQGRPHPSGFTVNPSVQWLQISEAASFLKKKPGLYLLWKTPAGVQEMNISEKQAHLLDQLLDDMLPQISEEDKIELTKFDQMGIISRS